jgi:hypothetical protein
MFICPKALRATTAKFDKVTLVAYWRFVVPGATVPVAKRWTLPDPVGLTTVALPITPTAPEGTETPPTAAPVMPSVVVEPPASVPAALDLAAGGLVIRESKTRIEAESRFTDPAWPSEPAIPALLLLKEAAAALNSFQVPGVPCFPEPVLEAVQTKTAASASTYTSPAWWKPVAGGPAGTELAAGLSQRGATIPLAFTPYLPPLAVRPSA